jgi:ferredoxin
VTRGRRSGRAGATTARVRFLPFDRVIEVPVGSYLTAAAARADVPIVHDCDGQGVCGTCRVRVQSGAGRLSPIDPRERDQLGADVDRGWRLCCLVRVLGNATVRAPEGGFAYPPELQR